MKCHVWCALGWVCSQNCSGRGKLRVPWSWTRQQHECGWILISVQCLKVPIFLYVPVNTAVYTYTVEAFVKCHVRSLSLSCLWTSYRNEAYFQRIGCVLGLFLYPFCVPHNRFVILYYHKGSSVALMCTKLQFGTRDDKLIYKHGRHIQKICFTKELALDGIFSPFFKAFVSTSWYSLNL